jgi:cytochrome oxidase assembly protein ShyY1
VSNRYGFLTSPRWIALTIFVLVLIPLFVLASSWQFDRLEQKRLRNSVVSEAQSRPAQPLVELVGEAVLPDVRWRQVTAEGQFVQGQDVLIRRKFRDNSPGYWVVSPLQLRDGRLMPVVRGWIPTGRDALTPPEFNGPPSGEVSLSGRLNVSDTRTRPRPTDLPAAHWDALTPAEFPWRTSQGSALIIDGVIEAITIPNQGLGPLIDPVPVAAPDLGEGPHLSYAWQWRIFVLLALVGWVVLVRSQAAREDADVNDDVPAGPDPRQSSGIS